MKTSKSLNSPEHIKLYPGDVVEYIFGKAVKVKGKILTDGNWHNTAKVKVISCDDDYMLNLLKRNGRLSCYHYSHYNENLVKSYNVKVIKRGWMFRMRKPFLQRLKYLFTNKF